jgi:predicted nucleotidyltransferase
MSLPSLNDHGELPEGVYQATLAKVIAEFGTGTPQRQAVTARLLHLYNLVKATNHLERFIIFGSYVTTKAAPNDVDIFLVMAEAFDVIDWGEETRTVFAHAQAQSRFGASVFWVTRSTSGPNIESLLTAWQTTRDQTRRGIVEVIV